MDNQKRLEQASTASVQYYLFVGCIAGMLDEECRKMRAAAEDEGVNRQEIKRLVNTIESEASTLMARVRLNERKITDYLILPSLKHFRYRYSGSLFLRIQYSARKKVENEFTQFRLLCKNLALMIEHKMPKTYSLALIINGLSELCMTVDRETRKYLQARQCTLSNELSFTYHAIEKTAQKICMRTESQPEGIENHDFATNAQKSLNILNKRLQESMFEDWEKCVTDERRAFASWYIGAAIVDGVPMPVDDELSNTFGVEVSELCKELSTGRESDDPLDVFEQYENKKTFINALEKAESIN